MKMRLVTVALTCSALMLVSCQNRSPADVCTYDRSKASFCNSENNCNATGVILCYGNGLGTEISCGKSQPFCAVSEKGDSCSTVDTCATSQGGAGSPFQCTGLGYFPNPSNCSSYYFCSLNADKTEYVPTLFNCPNGNVFSPSSGSYCTRYNSWLNNCKTVNCANALKNVTQSYVKITYGLSQQYYALCITGGDPSNPLIFVCPANTVPNISGFPATCEYRCWRTGFFENTLDSSRYFECYLNNFLRYESVERTCPQGSSFDSGRSECVVKSRSLSSDVSGGAGGGLRKLFRF